MSRTIARLATFLPFVLSAACGSPDQAATTPTMPDQAALCTPRITSTEVSGPTTWEGLSTSALSFKVQTDDRCLHTVRLTNWVFKLASATPAIKHWELLENGGPRVFGEIADPSKEFTALNRNDTFLNVTHDDIGRRPVNFSLATNTIGYAGQMFSGAQLVSVDYEIMGLRGAATLADIKQGYLLKASTRQIQRFNK